MSDGLAAIKQLYFSTTKATIARDFDRAIELLKSMSCEEERERAAVYMEGLAEMRSQWGGGARGPMPRRRGSPGDARRGNES
jgi:hypothetical protein